MSTKNIILRSSKREDADRLHELHTASVRTLCKNCYSEEVIDGWLLNRTPSGYHKPIDEQMLFVAEREGQIVGFGEAVPGRIVAVFVDPGHIHQGIGTMILAHAVEMARESHNGSIRLESTLNARDFYAQAGFREIKHSTVHRNHVEVPVVIMEYTNG